MRLKAGRKSWRNADGALVAACEPCEGRGWRIVDDYTNDDVGSEETGARVTTRTVFCDGCGGQGVHNNGKRCRHCQGAGTCVIPAEAAPERSERRTESDELTVALRAGRATGSARLWAAGSFHALQQALAELQPWARWKVLEAYATYETYDGQPTDLLAILTARVRYIERGKVRVPGELRRWAEAQPKQLPIVATVGERNAEMRRMRAEGASLSAIARRFGVAKTTAHRVTDESRP